MKLEMDETGVWYVFPEQQPTPEEERLDKLLEGSGWESPQPGTRMKLHPELMSPAQIEFIIQHETNPEIIDYFRRNQSKAQSWLS